MACPMTPGAVPAAGLVSTVHGGHLGAGYSKPRGLGSRVTGAWAPVHLCCGRAGGLQHLPGLRHLAVWACCPPDLRAAPALQSLTLEGPNGVVVRGWPELHGLTQLTRLQLRNMHPAGAPLPGPSMHVLHRPLLAGTDSRQHCTGAQQNELGPPATPLWSSSSATVLALLGWLAAAGGACSSCV